MIRRTLFGKKDITYVFSAQTTSTSVTTSAGSVVINITSKADGKNCEYTVNSYNGPITAVTTAATNVTIRYSANTTSSQRSGTVILSQNGSEKKITITITQNAAVYVFQMTNTSYNIDYDVTSVTATLTSTYGDSFQPYSCSWVTQGNGVSFTTAQTYVKVTLSANTNTAQTKTTSCRITQNGSNRTIDFTIVQSKKDYEFYVTENGSTYYTYTFPNCSGETITVPITSKYQNKTTGFSTTHLDNNNFKLVSASTTGVTYSTKKFNSGSSTVEITNTLTQTGSNRKINITLYQTGSNYASLSTSGTTSAYNSGIEISAPSYLGSFDGCKIYVPVTIQSVTGISQSDITLTENSTYTDNIFHKTVPGCKIYFNLTNYTPNNTGQNRIMRVTLKQSKTNKTFTITLTQQTA